MHLLITILHYICSGTVYYYTLTGSYWSRQSKLLAKDGIAGDHFGGSVSIYNNNAVIGSDSDGDKGQLSGVYINKYLHLFITIYVSICSGSVYYYILTGSNWSRQSKILAKDGAISDYFGASVSIYNNNAFIGDYGDDDKTGDSGMHILIYNYV
jgi:hypothetical protein